MPALSLLPQLSTPQASPERVPSPEEQEWAGPEALCPGWLEDEAPDGEVPGDSGDPDGATHAYERLQSALCQEGLPPTLDCSAEPRTGWGHGGHGARGGHTGVAGTVLWVRCQVGDTGVAERVLWARCQAGDMGVAERVLWTQCQAGICGWQE